MPPYAPTAKGKRKQISQEDDQPIPDLADTLNLAGEDSDALLEEEEQSDGWTEEFPEIFDGGLSESEDEGDSEADELQRERMEEALLEQELMEDSEEDDDDDDSDDSIDSEDPDALDKLIAKKTSKPFEANIDDELTPPTSLDERNAILGYDARNFNDKRRQVVSEITGEEKFEWDEIEPGYGSESGGEDEALKRQPVNRVGNIPSYFYDDMPHIGYDIDGKRVMRPAKGDELDKFLSSIDKSSWTEVEDKIMQQNVQLTDEELDLIHRLANSENPDASYDPYAPTIEYFSSKVMETPLSGRPEPKRRFVPSKWEHKKVMKIVAAIRSGRIVPKKPKPTSAELYNIWSDTDAPRADHPMNMPAPKLKLPTHAESYNPPAEYLFTEEEKSEWLAAEASDRKQDYIPQKFSSLRHVPGYSNFVQQRFERCLDLYLAPRMKRRKPKFDPDELEPKLPSPSELRPFPTTCQVTYPHPNGVRVRCVSIDPEGRWVVTGADDGVVRLWECRVGRCQSTWNVGRLAKGEVTPIQGIEWCPVKGRNFFVVVTENKVTIISPLDLLNPDQVEATSTYLNSAFSAPKTAASESAAKWSKASETEREDGILLTIDIAGTPKQITWHKRGDYFATVSPDAGSQAVLIHQITRHHTQAPFKRTKGAVQKVAFHPVKPHFFVATQRTVRLYDLMAQSLIKTLNPGLKWISTMDVHPLGDHIIIGSYDKRVVWHDLDLSDRPYKTLRYHPKAIRSLQFSTSHPLFLSASDDGTIHVFHATVYSDYMTEPLIVPLKVLRGHEIKESLGVLEARWHPKEPWVVSVGADGVGRLWCN